MKYNLRLIRDLINEALTPEEFDDLVFYSFRDVYSQFTNGQNQPLKVRLLFDYIEKYERINDLLNEIKEKNPKAFNEFQSSILDSMTPEEKAINNLGEYLQNQSFEQLKDIYLSYRPNKANKIVDNIDDILTQLNRIIPSQKLILPPILLLVLICNYYNFKLLTSEF